MSLLMDALRRAEAEKKQAAAEEDELAATVKLDRPPIPDNASNDAAPKTDPDATVSAEAVADDGADEEHEFSIHSEFKDTVERPYPPSANSELELEPLSQTGEMKIFGHVRSKSSDPSLTMPTGRRGGTRNRVVFRTRRHRRARKKRGEHRRRRNHPALAGKYPATVGDDSTQGIAGQTMVGAHTVFEAGNAGVPKRIVIWALLIGVALLALLVVSGIYYFQQAPTARVLPSPAVVQQVEPLSPAQPSNCCNFAGGE